MSKDDKKPKKEKKKPPHKYDEEQAYKLGIPMRLYRLVISGLRRSFGKASLMTPTFNKHKVKHGVYKCELCPFESGRKDFNIDHISPLISVKDNDDWNTIIQKTFDIDNLQLLCKECHTSKTKEENSLRAKNRRLKKKKQKVKDDKDKSVKKT